MAERSFSQLPISLSHSSRRMINSRRGIFPVSEYWIHAIPVIVFLCFFTLWFFSHSVSLDMNDGDVMSVHHLEKSMAMRNESRVSLAVLASSAVSPISANQNLTAHHDATQTHNATTTHNKPEIRHSQKETVKKKQRAKVVQGKVKREKTKVKVKQSSAKAKETLAGETLTGE